MSPARKVTHLFSVKITLYASLEVKERVERGEDFIHDPSQLDMESYYMGSSESKAGTAFYRAVKKAMDNPFALHVTAWRDGKILVRVKIDHLPER